MQGMINQFLLGGNVMACIAIGLFFLRFWRKTNDRLFALFALSFLLLGLNWLLLAFIQSDERRPLLYVIRLVAFGLILFAIWDKNRARPKAA